ncbi:hypothetical protein [Bradyrhizobium valentinum]|uniref:Uncharacterized protein n=1 Tax=Bradyrhizobium valentinum TaxID=1518501 RepID=A0A0R3LU87_9BRAD|nr:hypothetical protein [Bradyrhizobium valentinum]KRR11538.1 hypothetical protein CP49_18050 [Bradyrhizobium valentinum]
MTDTAMIDSPGAKPARRRKGATVTATALAEHLGVSRQYVARLADEGTIARQGDGLFDQDACRLRYLDWLRSPDRRSAKSEAEQSFVAAKTRLLEIRTMEKLGQLMPREGVEAALDDVVGIFLTGLSSMPARIGRGDLLLRRRVEKEVYEVRQSVSAACAAKLAAKQAEWQAAEETVTDAD